METIQRFQIQGLLGTGAMGTVYRAHDPQLVRAVAIKLLQRADARAAAEIPERQTLDLRQAGARASSLLDEARMMARLSHPNVVAVHEVGQHDGAVFVVMELVEGTDLRRWLAEPRSAGEIIGMFVEAGRGLAAAHAQHVVHRDFKPDNVLIGGDGRARVADFGLSRIAQPTGLVRDVGTAGTPRYLAPELWAGRPATAASDVYAFCVALAEAFGVDAPGDDVAAKLRGTGLPPAARAAVLAGLADDPARRPTVDAIVRALGERRRGRVVWWGLGGGAVLAVVGAIALATRAPARSCELRPLGAAWDATRDAVTSEARRGALDRIATALVTERRAACAAGDPRREACIARRVAELIAWTRTRAAEAPGSRLRIPSITAESCTGLEVPVHEPSLDLYTRYLQIETAEEATAVASAATGLGDHELACRAQLTHALKLRRADRIDDMRPALDAVQRCGLAIKSARLVTVALVHQAQAELDRAGFARAVAIAETAVKHAEAPGVPIDDRGDAYRMLGKARLASDDAKGSLEPLQRALALAREGKAVGDDVAVGTDLGEALFRLGRNADALAQLRETLARADATLGPESGPGASVRTMIAKVHAAMRQYDDAARYAREALRVYEALFPAGHSMIQSARVTLAEALSSAGDARAAHALLAQVLAQPDHGGMKNNHSARLARFAQTTFEMGQIDQGLELMRSALQELAADRGTMHAMTLTYRTIYGALLLEASRLDDASRELAAIEEMRARRDTLVDRQQRAILRGTLQATLLRLQGKLVEARALAERAVAEMTELATSDESRAGVELVIATIDADLGNYANAETRASALLERARADKRREDMVAMIEVVIARAEVGLGRRDAGLARARAAQQVLERYPAQRIARADITKLLGARPAKRRRRG